jgi:hypothetical protein
MQAMSQRAALRKYLKASENVSLKPEDTNCVTVRACHAVDDEAEQPSHHNPPLRLLVATDRLPAAPCIAFGYHYQTSTRHQRNLVFYQCDCGLAPCEMRTPHNFSDVVARNRDHFIPPMVIDGEPTAATLVLPRGWGVVDLRCDCNQAMPGDTGIVAAGQ